MRRAWWPLAVFACLVAVLGAALGSRSADPASPLINRPAPDFRLAVLDDSGRSMTPADLLGQPWILKVWASWCAPCRQEHPVWMDITARHPVTLVGLNYKDRPQEALGWLQRQGNPYRVSVADIAGRTGMDYGVQGVPETYVIDRHGVVRDRIVGPVTPALWRERLQPLLRDLERR